MTVQSPDDFSLEGIRDYAGRAPIQAPDIGSLVEALHYEHLRSGEYLGGIVWDAPLDEDATDVTFVAAVPRRIIEGDWGVICAIQGQYVDATVTLQNIEDSGTTVATLTPSLTGTTGWATDSASIADADVRSDGTSGGDLTLIYGDVDVDVDTGNSGFISHLAVYAARSVDLQDTEIITSWGDLPASPSDGDEVLYEDATGNRVTVEYDSTDSRWEMTDTGGAWVTIDDFDGGSIDTDLWTVDDPAGRLSVSGGKLELDVVSGEDIRGRLYLDHPLRPDAAIRAFGGFDGTSPSSGNLVIDVASFDLDDDSDSIPLATARFISVGGTVSAVNRWRDESGTNGPLSGTIGGLSDSVDYYISNDISHSGGQTTIEVSISDASSLKGVDSKTFSVGSADIIPDTRLMLNNTSANVNGTITVEKVQVKI